MIMKPPKWGLGFGLARVWQKNSNVKVVPSFTGSERKKVLCPERPIILNVVA